MPDDIKKTPTLTLNTESSPTKNNDSTKDLIKGSQETPQPQEFSEAATLLDTAEQKPSDNVSDTGRQGFFHGTKRKQMVPLLKTEEEDAEQEEEHKARARPTELCDDQACGDQCRINGDNDMNSNTVPLLSRFSFDSSPQFDYEKNLSPDFYQPFLHELFTLIAKDYSEQSFILTGSAAKQLQNSNERNPNDIDLLLKKADLVEGSAKLKKVLVQMSGASIVNDDRSGTLSINYNGRLFKVQVIDSQTSRHCFPAKEDENKHQQIGAIIMLDASVIPQKELLDIDDDLGSDIDIECTISFKL